MSEVEQRYTLIPVEIRTTNGKKAIGGYAAKFNKISQNLGGFVERIDPGFFNKARGDGWQDVVCRYNHRDDFLLGSTGGRTLTLAVDEIGLSYKCETPQSRSDVYELVERGDVNKSSFTFGPRSLVQDDWGLSDQGYPMRTLLSAPLVDVAPCHAGIAAYSDTSVGLRSLAAHFEANFDEVRTLAEQNELRRFFVRTDGGGGPKKLVYAQAAMLELQKKRHDPWEEV